MSRKVKKTTLVANAKQHAVMNTVQEKECQELQKAIEDINERHKILVSMMERQQKLMGEVPELRENYVNKLDFLEKELLKEREIPKWRVEGYKCC